MQDNQENNKVTFEGKWNDLKVRHDHVLIDTAGCWVEVLKLPVAPPVIEEGQGKDAPLPKSVTEVLKQLNQSNKNLQGLFEAMALIPASGYHDVTEKEALEFVDDIDKLLNPLELKLAAVQKALKMSE